MAINDPEEIPSVCYISGWSHLSFNLPLQRDHPVSIISRTGRTVHCHRYAHSQTLTALLAHWQWPGVCHTAAAGAAHVIGGASTNRTALRCVTHQQLISCLLLPLLFLLLAAAGSSCHRDLTSLFAALVRNWLDFFCEKWVSECYARNPLYFNSNWYRREINLL